VAGASRGPGGAVDGVVERLRGAGPAVALALLAAGAAVLVYQHNTGWMYDAKVYRTGGAAALHGLDVYRNVPPAFTYTPFAALLFVPLQLLPVNGMGFLLSAVSILCLEASVWLCLASFSRSPPPQPSPTPPHEIRTPPPRFHGDPGSGGEGDREGRKRVLVWLAACALAVWLDPVSLTLLLGQVNLVLMLLVLLDLSLPDTSRWKGVGVGVAAGIKLTPGFFVLYLVLTRRLRAAAAAAATFAATVALGFAVLPADAIRYWGGTFLDTSRVGDPQNVRSQSLRSLLVRWAHTSQGIAPAWVVLAVAVAVTALLLAVWAHRRGDELLAVCLTATATLLVSPITWQHHWTWVVPALIWLARRAWRVRSRLLWGIGAAVAVEFLARPYQWGIPVDRAADLHLGTLQLIQSSTYAVTALLFLALAAAALRRDQLAAVRPPARPTTRRRPRIEPETGPTPT
jgi:alpha-1,2-mannosyltransferase